MPRIEPLGVRQWPAAMRDALAAMRPPAPRHAPLNSEGRPKALNTLGTFAHHPALAKAFFTFNGHVLLATTLSLRQRELIILRVAVVCHCEYEWAQHVVIAHDIGLADDEIARVVAGPDHPAHDAADAALLRAVDQLIADYEIDDQTWTALSEHFDTQQIIDAIFTTGAYQTTAMLMRAFRLPLDDDLPPPSVELPH